MFALFCADFKLQSKMHKNVEPALAKFSPGGIYNVPQLRHAFTYIYIIMQTSRNGSERERI